MITYKDEDLGVVSLIIKRNAKRYSFSVKDGALRVIAPSFVDGRTILNVIEDNKPALLALIKKSQSVTRTIGKDFSFENEFIQIKFEETKGKSAVRTPKDGCYTVLYNEKVDFTSQFVQDKFRKILELILKDRASDLLPKIAYEVQCRIEKFCHYVSVSTARSRWGSCSGKGNITLSCYLLLTNRELVEYVICHEMAHLTHMDHSEAFWALVDTYVGGDSRALRQKLKAYRTSF